ncbi:Two-component sensor histidine kinase, contains HisKA and HATPase domains [Poseidonocella pacifica]|uniref:histidine kinase n=1 Tax=Poseidonocella pacifica TaxID=871651 RepID=A0A1I0YF72_9RHOB|nr:histidine kinase dimerization/phosphoacceptor domain -containing protein [Poseidonocella pacifica]SFB12045.1 Two-component sensor histidine kinase, contains HisKA and HATPase domains [Poseidonocella pacifica]
MKLNLAADGLATRLVGLLTLALLPLGIVSLYQTNAVINEADRLSRALVLAETERAASIQRELMDRAMGAARGLAVSVEATTGDSRGCDALLERFVGRQDEFIFAAYIGEGGRYRCASHAAHADLILKSEFREALNRQVSFFTVTEQVGISGQQVFSANAPVFSEDGYAGVVSVSVPFNVAVRLLHELGVSDGFQAVTVNRYGLLLSNTDMSVGDPHLPASVDVAGLLARSGEAFIDQGLDGKTYIFAVGTMIPGQAAVVGSWPLQNAETATGGLRSLLPLAFPMLMWISGIVVAYWGLHRLVIRHIRRLRDGLRRYALGERDEAELALRDPPREFAEAQQAFNRTVMILSEAERRREEDLREKTVLLREVHHRVKNNLQLIASIMNMQSRRVQSDEARLVLSQLQRRVRGLATVYRTLNSDPERTTLEAETLLDAMCRELSSMQSVNGKPIVAEVEADPVRFTPDQSVLVSMVLAEALNNAVVHAGVPSDGIPRIDVKLRRDEHEAQLSVRNTRGARTRDEAARSSAPSGLGAKLMEAFVAQLEGEAHISEGEEEYVLTITFPLSEDHEEPHTSETGGGRRHG